MSSTHKNKTRTRKSSRKIKINKDVDLVCHGIFGDVPKIPISYSNEFLSRDLIVAYFFLIKVYIKSRKLDLLIFQAKITILLKVDC